MEEPVDYDGVTFAADTDYAALARRALLWELGGSLPYDDDALDWVYRALRALAGTSHATKLIAAITAAVTDEARMVRVRALSFIESYPRSWGAEYVVDVAAGDRKGFTGVPGWAESGDDLEGLLLRAVASRINIGDERAIALAKKEALNPGQPQPLMAALTSADPQWVIDHAQEIARRTPATGVTMLHNLEQAGYDIAGLGVRIARDMASDPDFRDRLDRFVDNVEAKRRILNAIGLP